MLALTLTSALQATPSLTAESIVQECWKGHSHPQMSECVSNRATASAAELSTIEQLITQTITNAKQKNLLIKFKSSSSSYREYRRQQCQYLEHLATAGNGAADLRTACESAMDSQRAAQLKASESWLGL